MRMNKQQQELLDEAYENYTKTLVGSITFSEREKNFKSNGIEFNSGYPNYTHYTQEEFINKCKTEDALSLKWREEYRNLQYDSKEEIEHLSKHYTSDTEFSERWGLKIEERELSLEERYGLSRVNGISPKYSFEIEDGKPTPNKMSESEWYDNHNIPTKLIKVTYNDKIVESYEGNINKE
jgi:hypothetical protein